MIRERINVECELYESLRRIRMLLDELKKLNTSEIREMILNTEGDERLFYVALLNKVMQLRRSETLGNERKFGNYNRKISEEGKM